MRLIALLLFCTLSALQTNAQEVFWSEDFANGPIGWRYSTSLCGNFNTPLNGTWTLSSGTHNGAALTGVSMELSIATNRDYIVRIIKDGAETFAQGLYTIDSINALNSNLTAVALTLGAKEHGNTGLATNWVTNIALSEEDVNAWGRTALMLDNPSTVLMASATTLAVTSANGSTVLNFTKTSACGTSWLWGHRGHVGSGLVAANDLAITSPTNMNGSMIVNGDFYITAGANNPGAPPYPQFISELISPVIDLSGVTSAVSLEFNQLVRVLNLAGGATFRRSVSVSRDGGETWDDPINVNPTLAPNAVALNNNRRTVPLANLQGEANVRIKFTYGSDFYFWVIDDIAIVERIAYDMQVNENFFAVMPNATTPVSQVEAVPFLADIQNNGGRTATNVVLNLTITNDATMEEIYNSEVVYGDIDPDVIDENRLFDELLDPAALVIGNYTGVYSVSHDSTDLFTGNDMITWRFGVSDSLFTKEFGSTRSIAPAADDSYSYGNVFFTPNGDGHFARYVTFGLQNAAELTGRALVTRLYQWDGDINDDGEANPAEYGGFPIAFNEYTVVGDEGTNLITIPVDLDEAGIALEDNKHYMIVLSYTTQDDQACFMLASGAVNYGAMNFATDSLQFARYGSVLDVGPGEAGSISYSLVGFGFGLVPVVRLSIGTNPDLNGPAFIINSADEQILNGELATVFPNPASGLVQVKLNMEQASDVRISVMNLSGQVVSNQTFDNVSRETVGLDVSALAPGKYWIRIHTAQGIIVKSVVVAK